MAFEHHVLRHGEWVTETVDLQAVLKANSSTRPQGQKITAAPVCGILTRTVVESPVAHWILPVRLRSAQHIDLAFVGDHTVQIAELQRNGRLRHVIRKSDFGSRIRNAKVIGALPDDVKDEEDNLVEPPVKAEDDDILMDDFSGAIPASPRRFPRLPPQLLLLVLENGDCVFMFLRPAGDNGLEFVTALFQGPGTRLVRPGFHLTVDPSFRFMALSCAEGLFIVYELESTDVLNRQYARGEPLQPVKTYRPRTVLGVIQKLEFLHPKQADDYQIILLLIVVRNGKSRMVTYEWEAGEENLKTVFSEEKKGYRLPVEHQMPLLLIPLTVNRAFLAISQNSIAVCKDALVSPPNFEAFEMQDHEQSDFYHGLEQPLWTAWTRPYRLSSYFAARDYIYLAREDGVVTGLDIDQENILGATVKIVKSRCNISTAFCSLFDAYTDILVMGGDSGRGAIWQVPPRQEPIHIGTLPNWSPAVDLTTTVDLGLTKDGSEPADRVWAVSGRGVTGAVTEYKRGLPAHVGLEVEYQTPARQSWMLPADLTNSANGYHLLLSMPDRSAILHLSEDLADATEIDTEAVPYDLSSRSVAARQVSNNMIVQVTENYVVAIKGEQSTSQLHEKTFAQSGLIVSDADVQGNLIALSTHTDVQFHIRLLRISDDGTVTPLGSYPVDGEVTCLSIGTWDDAPCVGWGIWKDGVPSVSVLPEVESPNILPKEFCLKKAVAETLTSILCMSLASYRTSVVLGTRGGGVLTVNFAGEEAVLMEMSILGIATVGLVQLSHPWFPNSVLACCDGKLVLMADFQKRRDTGYFKVKHHVLTMDASDASKPSALVTSVTVPQPSMWEGSVPAPILITSGSNLLLAELQQQPGPVQRSIPVGGTPSRLMYSHALECLVVAVRLGRRPTLLMLDPDTGTDLSDPRDKTNASVDFVSGLGKMDDRIYGLVEWEYRSADYKWTFILVTTEQGRLLTIGTVLPPPGPHGTRGRIQYSTRVKKSGFGAPIYSVAAEGKHLVFCAGNRIHWEILDLEQKKFKPMKMFELSSFATSLQLVSGKIVAVTSRDSLEIIDPGFDDPAAPMSLSHVDPKPQSALHSIEMDLGLGEEGPLPFLVSNRACGVTGLWVPWQQPGKDCQVLFDADLPASVTRFRRGRTRPRWQRGRDANLYRQSPGTPNDVEILGVCLDGSLQHFTVLAGHAWVVLRLIQNLSYTSPLLWPLTYEEADEDFNPEPEPDNGLGMQIDGDLLQRCLDQRALEGLFVNTNHSARLMELIDAMKEASKGYESEVTWPEQGDGSSQKRLAKYFDFVYDMLEYYLDPVL